jgi:hypothetical protein
MHSSVELRNTQPGKPSLSKPWHYVGGLEVQNGHWVEVSGQLRAGTGRMAVSTEYEAGWAP